MAMGELVLTLAVTCTCLLVSLAWKVFNLLWLKPRKTEKFLRAQGLTGPSYKFLYGNAKEMISSTIETISKPMELSHQIAPRVMPSILQIVQKYGKVAFTWFGPVPLVIIMELDMIKEILHSQGGYVGKTIRTPLAKYLISGLVSHEGEKWAKHRKIINPAFHLEKLKMMIPAFYTSCSEMVNKWQSLIIEESYALDVWPEMENLSADVISRTAFGSSYEEGRRIFQLQTEQAAFVLHASRYTYIPGTRFLPTKRNRKLKKNHQEIHNLLTDLIIKREEAMKNEETHNDDLLGILMESNLSEIADNQNVKSVGMSRDDVIDECKLFFFAGQETTATLLVWTMIVLSMHRDWQEKAREEVLRVFGRGKPDFDGLNQLKIVTMILNEVLRLYPPVTFLMRTAKKQINIGEISFPKGTELLMPTLLIHHDRELWGDDAEDFNPERFSEGVSKAAKNRFSFLPFSGGPSVRVQKST